LTKLQNSAEKSEILHFLHKTIISLHKNSGQMICKDMKTDYI